MQRFIAFCVFALLCVGSFIAVHAQQTDYDKLKTAAEKFYQDASFSKAHDLYVQAQALTLAAPETRWVAFRLADTAWRAQAATQTSDSTKYDEARQQLEALVRDVQRIEDRDVVWAEAQESLGDFWWLRRDAKNWYQGWQFYQQALDFWAGSADLETARTHYLKIVWKLAKPDWAEPYYYYGYYGNYVPLEVLQNALKIGRSDDEKAHAHYLIAMTLRAQGGDWQQRQRVPEEFEAAIAIGKANAWYDDAIYYYAEWMMNYGRITQDDNNQWHQQPDFIKALALFRRITGEFQKGETRYYDQAAQQIASIIKPAINLGVANIFLPNSEIQFYLNWRNTRRVDLALYKVELTRDVRFVKDDSAGSWLQRLNTGDPIKTWAKETNDKGDYQPGAEMLRVEEKLATGAYLIEAKINGAVARDLILVSDATLVLKTSGKQALAYFCNVNDGSPIANANVKLYERSYNGSAYVWKELAKPTNADGIAVFDLSQRNHGYNAEIFAVARSDQRQAFVSNYVYGYQNDQENWRVYAFTDRPAYRPNETAQFKFIARKYKDSQYTTPANQVVEYEIADPQGAKVGEGKSRLNQFGSAWGNLELTDKMPLGEYHITFWTDKEHHDEIGQATLFRLEEYKLPEFKVEVKTPEVDGKKKAFKLGEKVEVNIQADYYFGGAVANANVEVIVYQNQFYQYWNPRRDYAWYYEDLDSRYQNYGYRGSQIKRETLKTDATGKAVLTFDTPQGAGQDFQYTIEARVTDASRREITSTNNVRVTRQRYYVYPRAEHYLYRPQSKVTVNIKALDANDQPVQAEGRMKLTRDHWYEIWLDANGREVKGEELKRLRANGQAFPPRAADGQRAWQLKFQGYEHEDITSQMVKTNKEGEAEFSFTPEREGYYRAAWTSDEKGASPITAETAVWVATTATSDLGYRNGGLEMIVDKDTFRAGQTAPVMLVAPTNDRYVLFSVETDELLSYQLIRMSGNVKLIELPFDEKHVPNIFLNATMVNDRQFFMDNKQIIVPPVKNFLNLEVKADREEYQPRDEGMLTVTAKDSEGKPVSAEVAVGLVDESVFYIQQDYAGDVRQFYYGTKRNHQVQTQSTMNQKSYQRLVEGKDKQLIDDRLVGQKQDQNFEKLQLLADLQKAPAATARGEFGAAQESVTSTGARSNMSFDGGISKDKKEMDQLARRDEALPINGREFKQLAELKPGLAGKSKEPAVVVRNDFRSTVIWQPNVITDATGKASVKIKFPDSLTTWKATARAATAGNQFGIADASARTKQPLIVRLQAPRFFVVGDMVTISAVINNNTDKAMTVQPALNAEGVIVTGLIKDGKPVKGELASVKVAANGEARVDWLAAVKDAGKVKLKVTGRGDKYADAMEKSFVAYEHGIEKYIAKSGKIRSDDVTIKLNIPKERKADSTTLSVQVAPSMAVTMIDALPYLINYPYGCTEQTMSRFLPAAITRKTLKDLGLKPETVMGKLFGGIESQFAAKTHTQERKDLKELDDMIQKGLERLYDFQHTDGGWGWWKDGESDHFMTAYVIWGLALAREAGIVVKDDALHNAAAFLSKELVEEENNYDEQAWMLHALASYHATMKRSEVEKFEAKAFDNLWTNRERLNAYTRALLALSAHHFGYTDKAKTLVENLENGVKLDRTPDTSIIQRGAASANDTVIATAHWGEDGIYWRWSDGGVEATAFALRAILAIDPQNKLIEPVTNWLVKNRRGAQWSNTRDTAITVLTLNDYLQQSGELKPELEYELSVNGQLIAAKKLTAEDALSAPSVFNIDRKFIRDGANDIRIVRKRGNTPIYFAANAQFFSLEEPVSEAGNEIFVRRDYYKLVAKPTLLKGYVYERLPLRDGETVESGERVEVLLSIEAKNNYSYLLFEDLKPAGLEAAELRSGENLYARELKSGAVSRKFGAANARAAKDAMNTKPATGANPASTDETNYTGRQAWIYQELRDRKVALFISHLPEGIWEVRYEMRAETPGAFHALPVLGHAMYVPEIRCNSNEARIKVEDKP
ncbi:MAG: alpha-2-macroglobulin [Acidobacteria bacterium]|nr:alpha-2-macroglobulin [Acidobacteriota bacterium]